MPTELRRVPSLPDHLADDDGHVWHEVDGAITPLTERTLGNGYQGVTPEVRGRRTLKHVHVLVAEAFHGPKPAGQLVRHLEGDKSVNKPSGLGYGSRKDNAADDRRHGKVRRGEGHPNAKLTAADVHAVRHALKMKVPRKAIAEHFGVSVHAVNDIALNRRWRDVPATPAPGRPGDPADLVAR